MKRASRHTLGCRLNQAETAVLDARVQRDGYRVVEFGEPTDVLVVNTCSVTEDAERYIGTTVSVLSASGEMDGFRLGATASFLKVDAPLNIDLANHLKEGRITRASDCWAMGQLTAERQPMRRVPVL
jgi:tRNA A37 methylthiotransferase MiaB